MEWQNSLSILLTCIITICSIDLVSGTKNPEKYIHDFVAFTVATDETDGFRHFLRSSKIYNIPLQVIGLGKKWEGGDMNYAGGAFKVNLLKESLHPLKYNENQIVMFTDSYDVLFLDNPKNIIEKFLKFDARIVFAAESYIWPDKSLRNKYPEVDSGYKFINSGAFIGFADSLYSMLANATVKNDDDDQLFYTNIYLDTDLREKLKIKLDNKAEIFQNLFGASNDVRLNPKGNSFELKNIVYDTTPSVLHGNGVSKLVEFRTIGNYLAERWNSDDGCRDCSESNINLENLSPKEYPKVLISIFISRATPFFNEFMQKIFNQSYPRRKISFFIYNNVPYHDNELSALVNYYREKYADFKLIEQKDEINEVDARHLALDYCVQKKCDNYFNVDSDAHLDSETTLSELIKLNRSIVAPLLTRPYKYWSNFWGALDKDGFYKRSFDYMDIVSHKRRGLWNVPYINSCYLINATVLKKPELKPSYNHETLDSDMKFCEHARKQGIYMYVDNRHEYGHLVDLAGFDTTKTNPNVYELFSNRWDWEKVYLSAEYHDNFLPNHTHLEPCPDVYWFPIVSPRFCKEFIEIMEAYGKWSNGSNNDNRLQGGYEAVPTRDIHMNQVGLEKHWLEFLNLYISPLVKMVFTGYDHDPPRAIMNFVVRYKPDEQPSLRPHHDSSTYTINIALNQPNIDYEGGGCKFHRYNCQVTNMKLGWTLMHPGRLTHYHEGLLVTNGVRYIMVSFVDP